MLRTEHTTINKRWEPRETWKSSSGLGGGKDYACAKKSLQVYCPHQRCTMQSTRKSRQKSSAAEVNIFARILFFLIAAASSYTEKGRSCAQHNYYPRAQQMRHRPLIVATLGSKRQPNSQRSSTELQPNTRPSPHAHHVCLVGENPTCSSRHCRNGRFMVKNRLRQSTAQITPLRQRSIEASIPYTAKTNCHKALPGEPPTYSWRIRRYFHQSQQEKKKPEPKIKYITIFPTTAGSTAAVP